MGECMFLILEYPIFSPRWTVEIFRVTQHRKAGDQSILQCGTDAILNRSPKFNRRLEMYSRDLEDSPERLIVSSLESLILREVLLQSLANENTEERSS